MFAGNFAPRGFALCDGQLLAISQNDALFSLFGTIYGGDGRTTFGLPDLRGRVPVHEGSGPGISPINLGAKGGSETTTLGSQNVSGHTHNPRGTSNGPADSNPVGRLPATEPTLNLYSNSGTGLVNMDAEVVAPAGQSSPAPFNNVQPYLCINFIVALIGVYPSRS